MPESISIWLPWRFIRKQSICNSFYCGSSGRLMVQPNLPPFPSIHPHPQLPCFTSAGPLDGSSNNNHRTSDQDHRIKNKRCLITHFSIWRHIGSLIASEEVEEGRKVSGSRYSDVEAEEKAMVSQALTMPASESHIGLEVHAMKNYCPIACTC